MLGKGIVVGLAGGIASGKTTISNLLSERYNFVHLRSSDILRRILTENGQEISEENLQNIGKKMINEIGGEGLSALVLKNYNQQNNFIYDSIRHIKDLDYFTKRFGEGFIFLFIEVPESKRRARYITRNNRDNTDESYIKRSAHPVELEVPLLKEKANYVVTNDNIDEVIAQIVSIVSHTFKNK